jgi:hypothetical protein
MPCPNCIVSASSTNMWASEPSGSGESVCPIVVVAVCLHLQQSDKFCKIQNETPKWTWAVIYVWRFFVLLSSGAPCACMCYTALRARGAYPLQDYWLLSLFNWATLISIVFVKGTGQNWTAGLVTAGCLAVRFRLQHSWYTFRTFLTWNDVAWLSYLVTFDVLTSYISFRRGPNTEKSDVMRNVRIHQSRHSCQG